MKIHYLTLALDEGFGGLRVISNVLNGLASRGHEITITTMLPSTLSFALNKSIKFQPIKYARSNLFVIGACRVLRTISQYDLDGYSAIKKSISKELPECDLNIAHSCVDVLPIYESQKGVPFHYMQHDEALVADNLYAKMVSEEAYSLHIERLVNSIWLKQRMNERHGLELPVVNPAIDHAVFFPREVKKENDKPVVLCFGRPLAWKGFQDAVQAMEIVKKIINVDFKVYGRKAVRITGSLPYDFCRNPSDTELAELYRSADLFICPSWYESFPLPPIEAMACGCPTVTTRYGTEDYAFNESNALVVPPRNPKLMAEAIVRLIKDENLRETFRKEGPKTAKQFTWDKTINAVEKLFTKVLTQKFS
jgi:glycosyltransferase involved in cell wall biosynthesis